MPEGGTSFVGCADCLLLLGQLSDIKIRFRMEIGSWMRVICLKSPQQQEDRE